MMSLLLRPDEVLSSVRVEPVETLQTLRQAQGERLILHRTEAINWLFISIQKILHFNFWRIYPYMNRFVKKMAMKHFLAFMLLAAGMSCASVASAAYYTYNDSAAVATAYPWIDISAASATPGTSVSLSDDSVSAAFNLGFTFNFGGTNYTQLRIGSNGWLFFAATSNSYTNIALPVSGIDAIMLPYWDDLNPASAANRVMYRAFGTAPNRYFVVSFINVPHYPASGSYTFQVQIYENGNFVYRYGATNDSGASATVGVEVNNTDFVQYSLNTASVPNNRTILWSSLTSLIAQYRLEEASWNGTAGEVKDTAGYLGGPFNGQAISAPLPIPATASPARTGSPGTCGYAALPGPYTNGGTINIPSLPVSIASGAKTSVAFWMYWDGANGTMPMGWGLHDLWLLNGWFGFNTANSDIYGISSAGLANGWHHVTAIFTNGSVTSNQLFIDGVSQTLAQRLSTPNTTNAYVQPTLRIGGWTQDTFYRFSGRIDELKVYNGTLVQAQVTALYNETHPCPVLGPDHIRIEHDGSALTCTAETLTVKACANAACSSLYTASNVTGNVTWAGAPGGSVPFTITGGGTGQTTVDLPVATAQSVTLGTSAVSPAPVNASQCLNTVSTTNSCAMTFSTSGFVVTVPDHVSCTNAIATIEAVQQGAPLNQCIPAFASVTRAVNLFTSYISPATGTMAATASTGAVSTSGPGTAHNLAFDATGKATITFNYPDAGQLTLTANGTAPTGAIMTGNATFVVAPASFAFSGIPAAPLKAGQPFNVTVTAKNACATPATTPNFTGQTVTVTSSNPQPGIGNATAINATLTATGGTGSTNLTWGEVGTIDLTASRSSYLGSTLSVSGSQAGVGRFQPAYFDTVVTPGCSAFTYAGSTTPAKVGQPFTVTATAKAVGGSVTQNYAGASYAYLTTLSNAGTTTGFSNNTMAATDFANGVATRNDVIYAALIPQTAPLTLTLRATNSDTPAVSSSGFTEGTTAIRSGRARLINAYGSELLDLPMPLTAQYWNGSAWTLNSSDTCTTGVNLLLADVSATDGLTPVEVCVWDTGSPGNSGLGCVAAGAVAKRFSEPPAAGNFNLNFRATGAGNSGSVDVTATVPTWLQFDWTGAGNVNPTARATFGIYKTPIIYMRENF